VESARLDGSDRRVVVGAAGGQLPHPVTLTVHADSVYWADWHTHAIYVASKHGASAADRGVDPRVVAVDVHQSTGLRAYDPALQPHGTRHPLYATRRSTVASPRNDLSSIIKGALNSDGASWRTAHLHRSAGEGREIVVRANLIQPFAS